MDSEPSDRAGRGYGVLSEPLCPLPALPDSFKVIDTKLAVINRPGVRVDNYHV